MNCPFCEPSIENTAFARSENFLAIYNLAPIFPGHSLIIPRKHILSVLELPEDELTEMVHFTREVTRFLMREFKAEAFNWSVQDREAAGQSVNHQHTHVVLRYKGDMPDPGDWYPKIQQNYSRILDSEFREKLTAPEMSQIVDKLRINAVKTGIW
jgi:bis(5'-adenosyl)-triphosphatase